MIAILCVDERNGMLFNNRRQSRDEILNSHIIKKINGKKMWITNFSKDLFESENIIIDNNFMDKIGKEEYVFIENIPLENIIEKVDEIIIYNWNRYYPADVYLTCPLDSWKLISENELIGSSHEKITERIYKRGNN